VKRLMIWKVKTRLNHSIGEGLNVTKRLMTIPSERVLM